MATTAVPTTQPSPSSPESGATTSSLPEERRAINWGDVLPQTRPREAQLAEFLRRREPKERREARVSDEVVAIAKTSLLRSLFLNSEAGNSYSNAFFAQVAGFLLNDEFLKAEGINKNNIPQDFEGKRKFFEDLVERFYKRFPDQAIALGVYSAASEWQMVMSRYNVSFELEDGQEIVMPDPAFIISAKRSVEVGTDGKIKIIYEPSREETYEEYLKRIEEENRRVPRLMFWRRQKPLSKEKFEERQKGQEGRYQIVINPKLIGLETTPPELTNFYFEKLGIEPTSSDENKQAIGSEFVFRALGDFSTLLNEIAAATGVPPEQRQSPDEPFHPLNPDNPILKVLGSSLKPIEDQINNEISQQAQREMNKRVEALKERQEASMRGILEGRKGELEKELEELRKRQEEAGKRGESPLPSTEEIRKAIGDSGLLNGTELSLLGFSGEGQLEDPGVVETTLQNEIYELNTSIAGYGDRKELLSEIATLRSQLTEASRSRQIKSEDGHIIVSPADTKVIDLLKDALSEKQEELKVLNETLKKLKEKELELKILPGRLERTITIGGQTKTIRKWIEAAREEGMKSGEASQAQESESQIIEKEKELAEITVLLEYFDERSIGQRRQRAEISPDQLPFDWASVSAINPELNTLFTKINKNTKKIILGKLYTLFGERYLFPQTPEDYERMKLINNFLTNNFKDLSSLSSDDIDNKLRKLRNDRIGQISPGRK